MARQLKVGEYVTVDEIVKFRRQSEPYTNGLRRIKPGQGGTVIGVGNGRSSIVDFAGIQATISNQRLIRVEGTEAAQIEKKTTAAAKRGRKSKAAAPVNTASAATTEGAAEAEIADVPSAPSPHPLPRKVGRPRKVQPLSAADNKRTVDTSKQLVTMITNSLLLNGGLKDDAVIALRFSDLPKSTQDRIRALIKAKLAMS